MVCTGGYQSATVRVYDPATKQMADGNFTFIMWHSVYLPPGVG